ncbi:hypothetical protein FRC09_011459 [Ceratobasidium sp. 395]|nr:hypothetical protein FRC09_011459 [Ceratobasidium sp. 395]
MTSSKNSNGDASNLHPLQIPELVDTICRFLDIKTCANLLFLSRRTYTAALPIIWRDVDARNLLRLIPGTDTTETSTDNSKENAIHFPATRDLTRFAIHAPFVKTLRLSDSYAVDFPSERPVSGPDATSNPLLPNLQRLIVTISDITEVVDWIYRLLYPGLLGLEMVSAKVSDNETISTEDFDDETEGYPWIDQDSCFELLEHVSRACPRLETLRLFPKGIAQSEEDDCIKIYNQIASLQHLRSLAFSGTIVHEELLKVLGGLPHLETLSLCTEWDEEWEYDESPLAVPDDSFPSLRHLYLYGLDESTMSRVCKVLPLFRHLVGATIIFEDQCFDENLSDYERSNVAVTCLGQNSPHLEELTILPRGNNGWFVITRPTLDMFKHMPLRCLRLGHFSLGGDNEDEDDESGGESARNPSNRPEIKWQDLLASVPQLEELRVERQPLDPHLLRLIAHHLPNLRLLSFGNIDLGKVKYPEDAEAVAAQPITLRGHSYFWPKESYGSDDYDPPKEETIHNAAKYILGIWPNVTACETHRTSGDTGNAGSKPDEATAAKLYAAIQSLKHGAHNDDRRQTSSTR